MAKRSKDLARILAKMDRIGKAPREKMNAILLKSANRVAALQRYLAESSRDTGDLIDSITVTAPGQQTPPYSQPGGSAVAGPNEALITAGNSAVRYPHLVEFGSVNAEAQPFFWPAYRSERVKELAAIKRGGRKIIRDIWDK